MANSVPLVRAGVLHPLLKWLASQGDAKARILATVGLPHGLADRPMLPVAYHAATRLIEEACVLAGPDGPCRMAAGADFAALGVLSEMLREPRTVGEALVRLSDRFGRQASHEIFRAEAHDGGLVIHSFINLAMSPLQRHLRQQYSSALVMGFIGARAADGCAIAIAPHPALGVAHLVPWFGPEVRPAPSRAVRLQLPAALCERPNPLAGSAPRQALASPLGAQTLAESAARLLRDLLGDSLVDLDRLALLTGRSKRTLQRQLSAEGTSFSLVLETVRRERALELLAAGARVTAAAEELGYASASVLSHAVRRWTGKPPTALRRAS